MHKGLTTKMVSIGLPTYNGSKTIRQSLDTLLSQTYKNLELIISDNASTDETGGICEEYAARDSRVRYVRQKENIGATNNFNFVLQKALGGYFMWATDDDLWEPDFIHNLVDLHIKNNLAVVCFCAYDNIAFSDEVLKRDPVLFPEHEGLNTYARFKRFLLDKGGKNNYVYGIFKTKYLQESEGFKQFDGIPAKYSSADTFFALEMLTKGPFVSTSKLLWHKRCNSDDFRPERTVRNLSVFKDKRALARKILHFIKTPYYALFFYFNINVIIKKSFHSLHDRSRLYFWNTYNLLCFLLGRFSWSLKLLLYFFVGILDISTKRTIKNNKNLQRNQ